MKKRFASTAGKSHFRASVGPGYKPNTNVSVPIHAVRNQLPQSVPVERTDIQILCDGSHWPGCHPIWPHCYAAVASVVPPNLPDYCAHWVWTGTNDAAKRLLQTSPLEGSGPAPRPSYVVELMSIIIALMVVLHFENIKSAEIVCDPHEIQHDISQLSHGRDDAGGGPTEHYHAWICLRKIGHLLLKLDARQCRIFFTDKSIDPVYGFGNKKPWPPHVAGHRLVEGLDEFVCSPDNDFFRCPRPDLDYNAFKRRIRWIPVEGKRGKSSLVYFVR